MPYDYPPAHPPTQAVRPVDLRQTRRTVPLPPPTRLPNPKPNVTAHALQPKPPQAKP